VVNAGTPQPEDVSAEVASLFRHRPDFAAMPTIGEVVGNVADHWGVPRALAYACGWEESGCNPYRIQDGVPRSEAGLGYYQLTPGGELGNLSEAEAFNVGINADVALSEFHDFKLRDPSLQGGAWAAAAQRPADPIAYAANIDSFLGHWPPAGLEAANAVPADCKLLYPPKPPGPSTLPAVFITSNPKPGGKGDFLCSWETRRAAGIPDPGVEGQIASTGVERHNIGPETFAYFVEEIWAAAPSK
jgi:hypothetical protein